MVAALALGSVAALLWGVTGLTSAPATRLAGTARTMLWSGVAATALGLALALTTGLPNGLDQDWVLIAIAGFAYAGGTGMWLLALNQGHVSLVTPIVSCDGAVAALLAVTTGESLSMVAAIALGGMVIGVLLVARVPAAPTGTSTLPYSTESPRPVAVTAAVAAVSAITFALVFFASGRVEDVNPLWTVALARTIPTAIGLAICLAKGSVRAPKASRRWMVVAGSFDAGGYAFFNYAAREAISVAAVAASQYAAVAALGGVVVLRERLAPRQWLGLGVVVISAAVIVLAQR